LNVFGLADADLLVLRQLGMLATTPDFIEREIPPHKDEPCGRVARWPFDRPVLQRAQAGLLISVFRRIECAEITQQCAEHLWTRSRQRRIDPSHVRHRTPPGTLV